MIAGYFATRVHPPGLTTRAASCNRFASMAPAVPEIVADVVPAAEAWAMLLDDPDGDFGKIPVARLVDHILAVTEDADWPVRKAALAASLRGSGEPPIS